MFVVWDYFYLQRAIAAGFPFDMINSPFAFPRVPPKANQPLGISNAGQIKKTVVKDGDLMMNRLDAQREVFHRYAMDLFEMSKTKFSPGHPMHYRMQHIDALRDENEKLRQENSMLKSAKSKEKKN